jgi:hypothetical protein
MVSEGAVSIAFKRECTLLEAFSLESQTITKGRAKNEER